MVVEFLADGFEEIEAITPVDLLRRAGVEITTVGVTGKTVTGSHNIKVEADTTEVPENIEMVILPGGNPGYINLKNSPMVKEAVNWAINNDRYVAAICAAPSILGEWGLLKGKNATVYPGMEEELIGANFKKDEVVIDGRIITSRGAGTAIPFAAQLINILKGPQKAQEILNSIVYKQ